MLLTRSRQLAAHLVHTGRLAARRLAARRVAALSTSSQARTTLAPSLTDAMQDEPASRDKASTVQTTALDRPRVVVLGTGWSSFRFVRELRREHYHVTVVSPRNHFLFTPLLPSTTVGTLEFRAIIEPIRSLKRLSFIQGKALSVDTEAQQVLCRDVYHEDGDEAFKVDYDYLVVGAGLRTGTFGIPGVKEHCFFLKQLDHARAIRNRIVELFERASVPGVSQQEQDRLLTFVVVGGGPTSVEFASELYDFIEQDVVKFFPELAREKARIVLVEASGAILGNFDKDLSEYAKTVMFRRRRIKVMTNTMVKEVTPGAVKYTDASGESGEIHSWLKVWSAGLEPTGLVQQLGLNWEKQDRTGRLHVTPDLRVRSAPTRCFAFGDCAVNPEEPLPCTASVADQQGKYLAKRFNQCAEKGMGPEEGFDEQFKYHNRGMMAYLGGYKGLADVGSAKGKGFLAWLLWRSAYLTMTVSISNKLLIPMFWFKSWAFGRDISRF